MTPLCTNCSFGHDLEFVNPLYKTFAGMLDITVCSVEDELVCGIRHAFRTYLAQA
jgi:hypothetical protein